MNEKNILELIKELEDKIRHNGVLIEDLDGDVGFLSKEVQDFNSKLSKVRTDVAEIKENTFDLPIIRKMVKQHERQLSKMR